MKKKIIKFFNIENLSFLLKKKGKKIVHCHGVFDLLHIGHLKHFKSAKKFGDILIVSITPDKFVNKGLNRPYFNAQQRLESLASIEIIDFVVLNNSPDSIDIIKKIKPNFYCKGPDYNNVKDEKPSQIKNNKNFILEKKICKKIKCKIKTTNDVKFSSTKIINENLLNLSNDEKTFLKKIKQKYSYSDIEKKIDNLSKINFTVIGDPIIDTYLFSDAMGVSSKSLVVSTQLKFEENYLGGSLAVAEMLANLGCSVDLLAYKSKNQFFLKQLNLLNKNINFFNISFQEKIPRISRFVHHGKNEKLFQYYEFDKFKHNKESNSKIIKFLNKKKNQKTLIIDFGFGFLNEALISILEKKLKSFSLNVHANSLNSNYNKFTKYNKYNYLTMNTKEFKLGLNTDENDINHLINFSKKSKINQPFAVTLGPSGSVMVEKNKKIFSPTFFHKPIDTVGSGDAFFAITSALNAFEKDKLLISFIGNMYAGLHSLNIGNKKFITKKELKNSISQILN